MRQERIIVLGGLSEGIKTSAAHDIGTFKGSRDGGYKMETGKTLPNKAKTWMDEEGEGFLCVRPIPQGQHPTLT